MDEKQIVCLFLMFFLGLTGLIPLCELWHKLSGIQRLVVVAWICFWTIPPLFFLFVIGIFG